MTTLESYTWPRQDDTVRSLAQRIAQAAARHREQLAEAMLAQGMTPADGWVIAQRTELRGQAFVVTMWPEQQRVRA